MFVSIIVLGYEGVIKHVIAIYHNAELYNTILLGIVGAAVNIFGVILNCILVFKRLSSIS
jgi:hypothetical protein